jgi:phosphatidylserine/phosphatidylglycerophosphate/cardiolipin synthase-like enzyme
VFAAILAGCATGSPEQPGNEPLNESETLPMVALEAYRGDSDFYVRYRLGDRELYAGGSWRDRLELADGAESETASYAAPMLLPMQYHRDTPWQDLPRNAVNIPVFGIDKWQLLRDRLLRSVVPGDGAGVVVNFDYAEYFLYYDPAGQFRATRLQDKPSGYRVQEHLYFVEFMRRGRPLLDSFLAEQGITESEFVFNTGDTGLYSLPFLYVNTELHLAVFVRNVPLRPFATAGMPGLKSGQAFGHLMQSHLTNLVQRPVSSLYRLFFVVTDTAASTLTFDWTTGLGDSPPPPLADAPPMNLQTWESVLDGIASRPRSSGKAEVLVDGETYFTRFIDAVDAASDSIQLQAYIFDNDDYAMTIGELLKRRSNEGVEVRVLLDGLGTISGTMADSPSLPEQYVPPASVRQFLESDSRVDVRQKSNPWFTGDHVKSTLIDHRIAFVGGMNIGREYRYDWHDMMMEIRGPLVDIIDREFHLAWGHAGPLGDLGYIIAQTSPLPKDREGEGYPLRVLLTEPGNYEIYNAQLAAIRRAQSYIYIQNAYFTDDSLLRELVLARRRGVDVRIVIPLESDHGAIGRSNVLAANLMLKHGIRVYLYPGFSHVKAAVYDGWACAGSANFDRWSLRLNRELNLASSAPEFSAQLLERVFEPDFRLSPELTEPVPERWIDHVVETFADYIY